MSTDYRESSLSSPVSLPTALLDLADALSDPSTLTFEEGDEVGLANGLAGVALLPLTLASLFQEPKWLQVAGSYFLRIAEVSRHRPLSHPGLYHGSSGIAFTLSLLSYLDDRYARTSQTLLAHLLGQVMAWNWRFQPFLPGQHNFELIGGATGILRFLLMQRGTPEVAPALERLLSYLLWVSEGQERWVLPPERLGPVAKKCYPFGYIDLGYAHGLAGPLAVLSLAALHGISSPGMREAIERWSAFLLDQQLEMPWGRDWPGMLPIHLQAKDCPPMRSSWCYGTPGIARALWLAGRALANESLCTIAREALASVFRRPAQDRNIDDPHICHGLAGVLLICLRFASDDPIACPVWLKEAIQALTMEFSRRWISSYSQMSPTFLTGSVGGALTLLAAMTPGDPRWDHVLLLS